MNELKASSESTQYSLAELGKMTMACMFRPCPGEAWLSTRTAACDSSHDHMQLTGGTWSYTLLCSQACCFCGSVPFFHSKLAGLCVLLCEGKRTQPLEL